VHHDLVDDDLGEQRGGEADELDGQAGKQDVAPDGLVLEEFRDEPFEAEAGFFGFEAGDGFVFAGAGGFAGGEDEGGFESGGGFFDGEGFRRLAAGAEVEEFLAVGLEDEDGNGRKRLPGGPVSGSATRKAMAGSGSFCQSAGKLLRPVLKPRARAAS